MCICLVSSKQPKAKSIYRYKLLNSNLTSPYRYQQYVIGENKSDRKSNKLTEREKISGTIENGLHVFCKLEDANKDAGMIFDIYKVKCLKEDFVASGTFGGMKSEVYTKVILKEKIKN